MSKQPGTTVPTSYSLELDITPERISMDDAYYKLLVSILSWIVEIGRVDICLEVSLISVNLTVRENTTKQENQREKLER